MKKLITLICFLAAWTGAISVRATIQEFPYVFEPASTGDGSALSEWGGSLLLYFSSSPLAGGGLSDINMGASFLRTPFGSFSLADSMDVSIGEISKAPVPFTWNPAAITSMDITGFVELNEGGNIGVENFAWQITDTSIEIQQPDPFALGPWVAGVPDSSSTLLLTGLVATLLCGLGHVHRGGQLSAPRR